MPLQIAYRPKDLKDLYGNEEIKDSIRSIINRTNKDRPHAYLFVGPSGCGKTTLARILANMLKVSKYDYYEYNTANTRGIDTIREISDKAQFSPQIGDIKFYVIDEVHKLTNDAQNAILKLLEDPPDHCYFALATTDPGKLLKTIKTRCTTYEVKPLAAPSIVKLLKFVLDQEGYEDYPPSILKEIAIVCDGCPRQALVLLDSVIDITDKTKALAVISAVTETETNALELCRALLIRAKWSDIREIASGLKDDPEQVRNAILTYCTKVMLDPKTKTTTLERCSELIDIFSETFIYSGKAGLVNNLFITTK